MFGFFKNNRLNLSPEDKSTERNFLSYTFSTIAHFHHSILSYIRTQIARVQKICTPQAERVHNIQHKQYVNARWNYTCNDRKFLWKQVMFTRKRRGRESRVLNRVDCLIHIQDICLMSWVTVFRWIIRFLCVHTLADLDLRGKGPLHFAHLPSTRKSNYMKKWNAMKNLLKWMNK